MPGRPMRPVARWQLMIALTLSVPRGGLVHALAVDGDACVGRGEPGVEALRVRRRRAPQSAATHRRVPASVAASASAASKPVVCARPRRGRCPARRQMRQQAVEQRDVACRAPAPDAGRRPSAVAVRRGSIDDDPACRARARREQALVAAPDGTRRGCCRPARRGRPRPDPHRRRAPRPRRRRAMAGDGGGHAEPGVGVDVAGADEALHQLVGDVVVLGQELAGDIEARPRPARARRWSRRSRARPGPARRPSRRACRRSRVEQPVVERRASRRAPRPWSRGGRSWPGGRGRRATTVPSGARPARRSRRRNRGRWCGRRRSCRVAAPHAERRQDAVPRSDAGPRSAAAALVGALRPRRSPGSMTQLCSGQVTDRPWTMPCDSGPPLCGQRSSSAKTGRPRCGRQRCRHRP